MTGLYFALTTDSYEYHPQFAEVPVLSTQERIFHGYERANGDRPIVRITSWFFGRVGTIPFDTDYCSG